MPRRDISIFNRNESHFTPFIDPQLEELINRNLDEMNDQVLSRYRMVGREFLLYGLLAATRKRVIVYDWEDYVVWPAKNQEVYRIENEVLAVSDNQRNIYVRSVNPERNKFSLICTLEHKGRYRPGEIPVPRKGTNERFATDYLEKLFQATKRFSEKADTYPLRPVDKPTIMIENIMLIPGREDTKFYLENCSGKVAPTRRPTPPRLRLVQS